MTRGPPRGTIAVAAIQTPCADRASHAATLGRAASRMAQRHDVAALRYLARWGAARGVVMEAGGGWEFRSTLAARVKALESAAEREERTAEQSSACAYMLEGCAGAGGTRGMWRRVW